MNSNTFSFYNGRVWVITIPEVKKISSWNFWTKFAIQKFFCLFFFVFCVLNVNETKFLKFHTYLYIYVFISSAFFLCVISQKHHDTLPISYDIAITLSEIFKIIMHASHS